MIIDPYEQERVLLFGQEGCGKSRAIWSIAKAMREDNSPGTFYYVDIDRTASKFKRSNPGWDANMIFHDYVGNWADMLATLKRWNGKAGPNDSLVLDGCGETWLESQGEYWRLSEGTDLATAASTKPSATDYGGAHGANWDRINKIYRELSMYIVRWPGHVFACTAADKLGDKVDAVYNRYEGFGWRPSGQKYLGHHFHTVILMQERTSGYVMSTVKDRERDKMKMVKVDDFSKDYLIGRAGWTRSTGKLV